MKTPERITFETLLYKYGLSGSDYLTTKEAMQKALDVADDQTARDLVDIVRAAIKADRAQRDDELVALSTWAQTVAAYLEGDKSNDWTEELEALTELGHWEMEEA